MNDICSPVGAGDHVVKAGDSILSIAARAGHLPETIWNDSANAALKEARKDGEVLLPGDRVTVMPVRPKIATRAAGQRWVFRRKGLLAKFTLIVEDEEGSPFASKKFELTVDGDRTSGTTGADGKIECAIAPNAKRGTLQVWLDEPGLPNPWIREITLAALYPIEHPIGVQQRLANLGHYSGPLDGNVNAATSAAVAAFQKAQGVDATGEIDDALRQKLLAAHKS